MAMKDAPTQPAPLDDTGSPAQHAKAALRRLALQRLEPTPDNYARAYAAESGQPAAEAAASDAGPDGEAWARLIERALRGLERSGRGWTAARKKDSLQRVLTGSRSDARRLHQRLSQLVASWDGAPDDAPALDAEAPVPADAAPTAPVPLAMLAAAIEPRPSAVDANELLGWPRVVDAFAATVQTALPGAEPRGREIVDTLAALQARIVPPGPDMALVDEIAAACAEARRVLQHRHHLVEQLGRLTGELTAGLAELAEDASWAEGQAVAMRHQIGDGLTVRGVRHASELLRDVREQQARLRSERQQVRDALKDSIRQMLQEIASLGEQTGRYAEHMGRCTDAIARADTLESLAGAVREMVAESRAVHEVVSRTQARITEEHARASEMQDRVRTLEDELRRLSAEVSTDPLTQVANRRGLMQAFDNERARIDRAAADGREAVLAVALLDIDNFKRLNDRLGHASGDAALQFLSQRVTQALRPSDTLARYGGEEFVVLLPDTPIDEAQQVLVRLQRTLSAELFMMDGDAKVFVTFSAGVTRWREGERIEQSLERADEALYEAKRTGKNRTCVA
ncbi:diguanylate cyclase domain-containing protein [Caldimonas sp. KR1-144]|uniref:GGDEF domain-containing protein n=1 Tax=Caldimonas sp. KR1-144 TaxID=3400911 RepID=UPI003BFE0E6B